MFKRIRTGVINKATDKLAIKIARRIVMVKRRFASKMNSFTRRWSAGKWKAVIVLFTIVWGFMSVRFILIAFNNKGNLNQVPAHYIKRKPASDSLVLMEHIYEQRKNN